MQTFLPYPDFEKSAEALDKKRCWKQVVEAKQIINTLEINPHLSPYSSGKAIPWGNHPAVLMWKGYAGCLSEYFNVFLDVCKSKHKIDTKYEPYDLKYISGGGMIRPWWLGNEDFHRAMRARLIEKDEAFYYPKWPDDEWFNGAEYLWPVMDGSKTFKMITTKTKKIKIWRN